MSPSIRSALVLSFCLACSLGVAASPRLLLVHYMPWFSNKATSGEWGWHWTMGKLDPDIVDAAGRHQIASHHYPVIGPYDSSDPDVLEYHALLMKVAGIDGVIFDWYGRAEFRDYAQLNRNTIAMIGELEKAGLQYALCYEDQTLKHMIEAKFLVEDQAIAHGTETFQWLESYWFSRPSYVKVQNRPLLLVFGPQYYTEDQWHSIFEPLVTPPWFASQNERKAGADAAFGWPPVFGNREIPREEYLGYVMRLRHQSKAADRVIATAFPGFHDFYEQAGVHPSWGHIDSRDGATFEETLKLAMEGPSTIIQIATWNDFGEGTEIEPTLENGTKYLESVQTAWHGTFVKSDLELPLAIYRARKANPAARDQEMAINQAAAHLLKGNGAAARKELEGTPIRQ